ncbi:glycosyltransferase family 4 protein [Priestia megaterium]|uniref:glycosyltransferase family 4 protein n=1 Tax=Priestia megaterium TaxID=1404 RepID=UPI00203C7DCF|nr:glycosyltransferase family 4 protein [Priestia megaterium]MCM3197154.1 glycosyltransferase family 4 protein [Priestia megaterium]
MKILFVSYYPLPYPGGIWTFVSHLKEQLEQQGHTVDVLSHNSEATKYRLINQKPELLISELSPFISEKLNEGFPKLNSNPWIFQSEINRYSLELSSLYYGLEKYDIIYAQDTLAACAIKRVKPPKTPLVTSVHGHLSGEILHYLKSLNDQKTDSEIKDSFEYHYHKTLENAGYHSSDLIHVPSKWLQNIIVNEFSISPTKVITFPYGLNLNKFFRFIEEEASIPRPNNKKVILYTGRIVHLKGMSYLIEALGLLKHIRNDWECWILGEGDMEIPLQQKCKDFGIENDVKFLGVSNSVSHFLEKVDIFVLPSLQDNQPYSVMEAQLMGVPVIVSDAGGLPEMVINGEDGLVVAAGNSQQLYERFKYLLENDLIRKQLGSCAKEKAQNYWSMNKMVNNVLAMYTQALENN